MHTTTKVEAFSVGLGPKLLSYRAGGGKGGFFNGTLSGPFSSASDREDGNGDRPRAGKKVAEAAKKTTSSSSSSSFWSWAKKEQNKEEKKAEVAVELKELKEPEGVEVSIGHATLLVWLDARGKKGGGKLDCYACDVAHGR